MRCGRGFRYVDAAGDAVARTVREVAEYLGNTPAVARRSYIDPRVIEAYEHGVTVAPALERHGEAVLPGELATIGPFEQAVAGMIASLDGSKEAVYPQGKRGEPDQNGDLEITGCVA